MEAPLYRLTIATPCKMKWSEMRGDDRVRYCSACQLNVHNVSEMSAEDVEKLLQPGGKVCARLYRRRDGTVVTGDCRRVWKQRRADAVSLLNEGANILLAVVLVLLIAFATLVLFGDNIRRMFGTETGALAGTATPSAPVASTKKPLTSFGNQNSY